MVDLLPELPPMSTIRASETNLSVGRPCEPQLRATLASSTERLVTILRAHWQAVADDNYREMQSLLNSFAPRPSNGWTPLRTVAADGRAVFIHSGGPYSIKELESATAEVGLRGQVRAHQVYRET